MTLVPNYVPTDWVDTVTSVDASRMDNLDVAVDSHADAINTLDTRVTTVEGRPVVPTVVNGQWLKGSGGAMVWAAIQQADVSGLSAALNAKQDLSAKGAVNGYASLDSGGKVPTTQLPVSIDLRWAGTYAAATAYKEGDVVIYNGVSYMALRPSTGETPAPWSTAAGGGLTSLTQTLGSDTTIGTATTWTDSGISLALTAGTWLVFAVANIQMSSAGSGNMAVRLHDGTSVYTGAEVYNLGTSMAASLPLIQTIVASGAMTLKLQAYSSRQNALVKAALVLVSGQSGSTSIHGIKVG